MKLKIVKEIYSNGEVIFAIKKLHRFLWKTWWSDLIECEFPVWFYTYEEAIKFCEMKLKYLKYSETLKIF